jgi:hypothetical protein
LKHPVSILETLCFNLKHKVPTMKHDISTFKVLKVGLAYLVD